MTIRSSWIRGVALVALAATLVACATRPDVRTQSAPALDVQKYQSFGFVEKPDTDKAGYTTLTTRYLKDAVTREMAARGYTLSEHPDLLVNFSVGSKDKVEGSMARRGRRLGTLVARLGLGWNVWRTRHPHDHRRLPDHRRSR